MVGKSLKRRLVLRGATAAVMAGMGLFAAPGASAAVNACGTGEAAVNAAARGCSVGVACEDFFCSVKAEVRADGVGLVGGRVTIQRADGSEVDTDSCSHLFGCTAAAGDDDVQSPFLTVVCVASGPALFGHAACTVETHSGL
jgi:hypothetical protein